MKQLFLLKPSPASATGFFVTTRKFLMTHGGNFKTFCVNVLFFLLVLLPFYNHCQTACSSRNFFNSCHALCNFWEKEQFCEQTLHKRSNLVNTLDCLHKRSNLVNKLYKPIHTLKLHTFTCLSVSPVIYSCTCMFRFITLTQFQQIHSFLWSLSFFLF